MNDTTNPMDSILISVRKVIGVGEEDDSFDSDIILHINSVLMILNQLGIGPTEGFSIIDGSKLWVDFLGDRKDLEGVKTFVYLKVKLLFDPPTSAFVKDAVERQIDEFTWRLNVQGEGGS